MNMNCAASPNHPMLAAIAVGLCGVLTPIEAFAREGCASSVRQLPYTRCGSHSVRAGT
jgi:hypothetical protein